MSKHSPGPWRVLVGGLVWTDQPGRHGIETHGHSICQITEHRTSLGSYYDEDDARLIAAAPKLLEELKESMAGVFHSPPCAGGCRVCRLNAFICYIEDGP